MRRSRTEGKNPQSIIAGWMVDSWVAVGRWVGDSAWYASSDGSNFHRINFSTKRDDCMYAHQTRMSGHAVFTNMLTMLEMSFKRLFFYISSDFKRLELAGLGTGGGTVPYIRFTATGLTPLFVGVVLLDEEFTGS